MQLKGLVWGSAVSSPSGVWGRAPAEIELVHFGLEIWHLVATIVMILLRINWPNFVQFSIRPDVLGRDKSEDFKASTPWNPGQEPEIKDCPGKSRTDGHLNFVMCNFNAAHKLSPTSTFFPMWPIYQTWDFRCRSWKSAFNHTTWLQC